MKLLINTQRNGACPMCRKESNCLIRSSLIKSVDFSDDGEQEAMEIAIFICPKFEE